MMKLFLLLAVAAPALAQCPYVFSPSNSQNLNVSADASTASNTITVTVATGCNWQYGTDVSWISFPGTTNNAGFNSGNGTIAWQVPVNIGPGARVGHIIVQTINGGSTVFTVVQAAPTCSMAFNPASASYPVGGGSGSFQLQTNCVWAAASQNSFVSLTSAGSGSLNATLNYTVAPNLCVAQTSGSIAVQAGGAGGPISTFPITEAGSNSNLTLAPAALSAPAGATTGTLAIATASGCPWVAFSNVSWLTITGTTTSGSGNFNLPYSILANTGPARSGSIVIGPQLFTVTQAGVAAPAVVLTAVANGADYAQSAVSPGDIVAIFGTNIGPVNGATYTVTNNSLPTTLGGVQVMFDNVAAPLLYASAGQVNAVAPYEISGNTKVQVVYQSTQSNVLTLPVQAATPGILTLDRSGFGGGAILNVLTDGTLTVNTPALPASPGQAVVIYCVGGGVTNPASVDGAVIGVPAPVLAQAAGVTVSIGGQNAQVLYAGAVSYSIAGLTQINAIVPPGLTAKGQLPVQVSIGGVQSQTGVTIAIQ